ncbi:MAG TPA: DUF445 family protein, partial [Gemmatimonadales bacterium]|nr:DUF445 family protein [Gemmatimonadales bacterium]
ERERGPLRAALRPELAAALDDAVAGLAPRLAQRAAEYARSDEFEHLITGWLVRLRREVGDRPVGSALSPGRRDAIERRVAEWVARLAEGDELERTLRKFVDAQFERLSDDQQPLLDRLPPGIVGAVEQAITDYLPIALERLAGLLSDPEARQTVQNALRDAFDHSVRELLLHERLLARLVVTDRTIERLVDGFEHEGFDRFAESLHEPGLRNQVTRAVNDAVVNFLRMPVGERLQRLEPERRAALVHNVGDWLVRVVRDPATRAAVARLVGRLLDAVEERTWGELLELVPPAQIAELAEKAISGERGRQWVAEAVTQVADSLLDRPLGRPANWLGAETTNRITAGTSDAVWHWLQEQIPRVVQQLRVEEMVEQKVLGFSTQRMEEIVRTVTQRELDLIVRLGYVLGAMVGVIAFGVNVLLS